MHLKRHTVGFCPQTQMIELHVHDCTYSYFKKGCRKKCTQQSRKVLSQEAMDVCFQVLKESNKSRFDSFECQEKCVDHIPYYLSGLSHAQFLQNK